MEKSQSCCWGEDSDGKGHRKASVVTGNLLYPDFGRGCNGNDLITSYTFGAL